MSLTTNLPTRLWVPAPILISIGNPVPTESPSASLKRDLGEFAPKNLRQLWLRHSNPPRGGTWVTPRSSIRARWCRLNRQSSAEEAELLASSRLISASDSTKRPGNRPARSSHMFARASAKILIAFMRLSKCSAGRQAAPLRSAEARGFARSADPAV
jgi:hypothetical protein